MVQSLNLLYLPKKWMIKCSSTDPSGGGGCVCFTHIGFTLNAASGLVQQYGEHTVWITSAAAVSLLASSYKQDPGSADESRSTLINCLQMGWRRLPNVRREVLGAGLVHP